MCGIIMCVINTSKCGVICKRPYTNTSTLSNAVMLVTFTHLLFTIGTSLEYQNNMIIISIKLNTNRPLL